MVEHKQIHLGDTKKGELLHIRGSEGGEAVLKVDPALQQQLVAPALERLQQGELPHNEEIDRGIERAQMALEESKQDVETQHGELLLEKVEGLLDAAQRTLHDKNEDEKLQKMVMHAAEAAAPVTGAAGAASSRIQRLREPLRDLARSARSTVAFIITNGSFRELLYQLWNLFFENFGDELRVAAAEDVKEAADRVVHKESIEPLIKQSRTEQVVRSTGKGLSEEQKHQLDQKLMSLLRELSHNEQYRATVHGLNALLTLLQQQVAESVPNSDEIKSLDQANKEAQDLIMEFAGEDAWNSFKNELLELRDDLAGNTQLQQALLSMRDQLLEIIDDPILLDSEEIRDNLSDNTQLVLDELDAASETIKTHFGALRQRGNTLLDSIKHDKDIQDLQTRFTDLLETALLDEKGHIDPEKLQLTLRELKNVAFPILRELLQELPLPMVQGHNADRSFEYVLRDIKGTSGLLPEMVDLRMFADFNIKQTVSQQPSHFGAKTSFVNVVRLTLAGIRPTFQNFAFSYKKHNFPPLEDKGRASMRIGSGAAGMLVQIDWAMSATPQFALQANLKRVKCVIDRIDVDILEGHHKILDSIILKLWKRSISTAIQQEVEHLLRTRLEELSGTINSALMKAHEKAVEIKEQAVEHAEKLYSAVSEASAAVPAAPAPEQPQPQTQQQIIRSVSAPMQLSSSVAGAASAEAAAKPAVAPATVQHQRQHHVEQHHKTGGGILSSLKRLVQGPSLEEILREGAKNKGHVVQKEPVRARDVVHEAASKLQTHQAAPAEPQQLLQHEISEEEALLNQQPGPNDPPLVAPGMGDTEVGLEKQQLLRSGK